VLPSFSACGLLQLECYACAELSAPRLNGDAVPLGIVVDLSEIVATKRLTRQAKAGMVQGVHPVGSQLQANALSELEILSDGQVKDSEAGSPKRISTLIAERERNPRGGRPSVCKCRRVKPLIGVWTANVRGRYHIRKPIAAVVYVAAGGRASVVRGATGQILV